MSEPAERATRYHEGRERIGALVGGLDDAGLATGVPATPGWDVKAVVSHLAGIASDIVGGRLDGVGTDDWTAAQVDARRDADVADILAEWAAAEGPLLEMLGPVPDAVAQLHADLVVHELDVRGALGVAVERDGDDVALALDHYAGRLGVRLGEAGVPALRLVSGARVRSVGPGEPAATLRGSELELLRVLSGRRSAAQVRALEWDGDVDAFVEQLAAYHLRDEPLVE